MTTLIWIVIAIVVIGVVIYLFKDKIFKKGGSSTPPQGPNV